MGQLGLLALKGIFDRHLGLVGWLASSQTYIVSAHYEMIAPPPHRHTTPFLPILFITVTLLTLAFKCNENILKQKHRTPTVLVTDSDTHQSEVNSFSFHPKHDFNEETQRWLARATSAALCTLHKRLYISQLFIYRSYTQTHAHTHTL